jgi:hypothetical protein
MQRRLANTCLVLALLSAALLSSLKPSTGQEYAAGSELRIYGVVNRPLNLTYAELLSFPMVSEVANLKCVVGIPNVTYNWTGVPLFYLLTLAEVKPEAYKIATRGSGGFSSDLLMEDALKPTTILALAANGSSLPEINGIGGYRLVVPCKYGYKWVGDVQEIEVVDYNYLGTYESSGWEDDASVDNCGPLPIQTPPVQTFNLTYGNRTFTVGAFTNASIKAPTFDPLGKALNLNLTVPQGASGFADFILQQNFLRGPYNVTVDQETTGVIEADTNETSYLYSVLGEGTHAASILGTKFFGHIPEIILEYNATVYVGQNMTFDASRSVDYGRIVSYDWSFGDGTNGTGAVVSHLYNKKGTYQVNLNVTNNDGISNFRTLTVTVESPPEYIALPLKVFLAGALVLLILMFAVLLTKRRGQRTLERQGSAPDVV